MRAKTLSISPFSHTVEISPANSLFFLFILHPRMPKELLVFDSYVKCALAFVQQSFYIFFFNISLCEGGSKLLMKKRKCAKCGANLTDEDVMKLEFEDGSCHVIPLTVCPDCFAKQMLKQARPR